MSFWTVCQTHSSRENTAAENLARQGFETFLPKIKMRTIHARSARVVPLFPSYLFLRIVSVWYPVVSTVGVLRLLRNGSEPAKIGDHVIREIRAREVRGIVKLPSALKIGDQVRILRGAFRDFIAVYDGMGTRERQRVLLELLGRKVPLELDESDFSPLDLVAR